MPDLPTGTVTFLFTDIEGSTIRWEQHREAMQAALARHDAILRQAIEAHGGHVFKTVGDAFYAAFATTPDALASALTAQRTLGAAEWGETGALRVRMALHTGTAEQRDGDYFGQPLNRVARLLVAGYGGQVLLSSAAQILVRDQLPAGVELRDLGEHRLKDLTTPEHIFQVVAPDLPAEFPPLKTLDNHPNNLPIQPTPLIGREHELEAVCTMLQRSDVRLLTLTGPGGIGKTRLGVQVAAETCDAFAGGVLFVTLASIRDPGLVVPTIAETLGIPEVPGQPLGQTLKAYFRDNQMLLVLDNFEQVLAAAAWLGESFAVAPKLKVLVTSRVVLNVNGEHTFNVPTLALPDRNDLPAPEQLAQYAAIRLFVERAQAAKASFAVSNEVVPAIVEICYRLDGLPLAIQLAAPRIRIVSLEEVLARLENRLNVLTGGARALPARQQYLRATLDCSYGLLDPGCQLLFARLAVFAGGCTMEAAEAVCNTREDLPIAVFDGLASLVDNSLLRQDVGSDGTSRFVILETIREYARERLEANGEVEGMRRQHARFFLALAEQAELAGPQQVAWLQRLEEEHDNLRLALEWLLRPEESVELFVRLAGRLSEFWSRRGYLSEGRRWLEVALRRLSGVSSLPASSTWKAYVLNQAGILAHAQGDYRAARRHLEETLALARKLEDTPGIATALANLGNVAYDQGDYPRARTYYEETLALARKLGDTSAIARTLNNLGNVAYAQGDYRAAPTHLEEVLALARELGDTSGIATALINLGNVAYDQGDYPRARAYYEETLALARELGDTSGIARTLNNLGSVTYVQGDYPAHGETSRRLLRSHGSWRMRPASPRH